MRLPKPVTALDGSQLLQQLSARRLFVHDESAELAQPAQPVASLNVPDIGMTQLAVSAT